jgi:asparagine synthase (glutamine-hydrolysing)
MCGIAGLAGFFDPRLLESMLATLVPRGPDGDGRWLSGGHQLAIGMRRLAIIDIEGGAQPFVSADGRVAMVCNGEIYNYLELREELTGRGYQFVSRSDCEVVLAAYLEWGETAWQRLIGMFAIAIADTQVESGRLILVRDRAGMKPLYYSHSGGKLVFASEIKALTAWDGLSADVDLSAVRDYLSLRYVPGPGSLLSGVRKLPAGTQMVFALGRIELRQWWHPPKASPLGAGENPVEAFVAALRFAVRCHLVADVPVGAFLSGGLDSGVIVALMAEFSSKPVHTYSIGFSGYRDSDISRARLTANSFGTRHTEIECHAEDVALLPEIAWALDEPIGDAIVVPMYVLAREARKSVTVVLSGEGADELLGGYMFHRSILKLRRLRGLLPKPAWKLGGALIDHVPAGLLQRAFDYPAILGGDGRKKIAALIRHTATDNLESMYRRTLSLFDDECLADAAMPGLAALAYPRFAPDGEAAGDGSDLQRLLYLQWEDWLPDDILMKLDKMTMAASLEGRVPFMDDGVVQAASRLPDVWKLGGGVTKRVLRAFAKQILPPEIVAAPKEAFYIPLESYVSTRCVNDLMCRTLDSERTKRRGLFRPEWIARQRQAGSAAGFLPFKRLMAIVMLELWFERFSPDASWA